MAPSDVWDPEFGPGLHPAPTVSVSGEMRYGPGYDIKLHPALTERVSVEMRHWAKVRLSVVGLCVLAHSRHFPPGDMPKSLDCWQHVVRPS